MLNPITPPQVTEALGNLLPQLEEELGRVLAFWAHHMIADSGERIVGEISNDGKSDETAPVGVVYLSRILWTFSRATEFLGESRWKAYADIAYSQLCSDFFDDEHGGVFWKTAAYGRVLSDKKQAYAHAFALYGLSAYARVSASDEVKAECDRLFDLIEQRFLHADHGGYWEALTRDWGELQDSRLSSRDHHAPMSLNTHLHIMEAYSEYFRTYHRNDAQNALRYLVELFLNRMYIAERGHLRMFWNEDWQDVSTTVSYGHEIEASWLLHEAAELVGDSHVLDEVLPVVFSLVDNCRKYGTGPLGETFEEADDPDTTRVWWCQAEALVGYLNAYQLRGGDADVQSALSSWEFIKQAVIDKPLGEWRWYSSLDEQRQDPYIGGEWKACYHNGRALMEAITRIRALLGE